jgi:hypothetical protein
MKMVSIFKNTMGVTGVEVLSLDDCSEDVKNDFQNAVRSLKDPTFERMVVTNEGKERVEVLIRIENEVIREVAMMVTGEDYALIRIKGKIKKSDIEKLSKKNF